MGRYGERLFGCRGLRASFAAAVAVAIVLTISISSASAEIVVSLAGPGAGTVTSSVPGINCSNVSGSAGPSCSASYGFEFVELTAIADSGFVFTGWSGNDPFGGVFGPGPPCDEGTASPCTILDPALFGEPPTHITATFSCAPPVNAPQVVTGGSVVGDDPSVWALEGEVDPEGCGLEKSFFEYGTSTEYGQTSQTKPKPVEIGRVSDPVAVTAETEPLAPVTTYHYRLVAIGPGGTSRGIDRTFTTGPAPPDTCPNAGRRAEQGAFVLHLPDCLALEMVSPPQKSNLPAHHPSVSANGSRVAFISPAALGERPGGVPPNSEPAYVASRGDSGWTSQSTVPDKGFSALWEGRSVTDPSFTPDFSRWLGIGATEGQTPRGITQAYESGPDGFFEPFRGPLVPLAAASSAPNPDYLGFVVLGTEFQGASADHSHLYFKPGSEATYFPGDPSQPGHGSNVYLVRNSVSDGSSLELLQRDRNGKVWGGFCGARLGGIGSLAGAAPNGLRNQGAISADGSRTYLSARASQPEAGNCEEGANKLRILERLESPAGPQIFPLFTSECNRPSQPEPPGQCQQINGDDFYQGASLDQTKVYFTTNRQLTNSDSDGSSFAECSLQSAQSGCDLYLYDRSRPAGERLVQVSAGEELGPGVHEAGREAEVYNGITAISTDGSHVYFVAAGVLTEHPNPAGKVAQAGKPNLYLWDEESEQVTFLGTLAAPAALDDLGDAIFSTEGEGNGLWGGQGTWNNNAYPVPVTGGEGGGDGHILLFESRAELTSEDADGRHLDVYRYDADLPGLECLSCLPGSSALDPDEAPFDVDPRGRLKGEEGPLGTDFAESRRWVSEDGEEVGFITPEPLLPGDINGAKDIYLWRGGTLIRLPGRPFGGEESQATDVGPYLSHDGSTAAFVTATQLLPQDGDKTGDVYVARIGGGYPNPSVSEVCEPGNPSKECQQAAVPPSTPQAASEKPGSGNSKRRSCPKKKIRRKGRCVAKNGPHRHKHHTKKRAGKGRHHVRKINADRRVAK